MLNLHREELAGGTEHYV